MRGIPRRFRSKGRAQSTSDGRIHQLHAGTQLTVTNFNPASYWVSAWQGQYSGETLHIRSDMPGTVGNKVTFTALQVETSPAAPIQWTDVGNVGGLTTRLDCPGRYHLSLTGVKWNFQIWTNPLNLATC